MADSWFDTNKPSWFDANSPQATAPPPPAPAMPVPAGLQGQTDKKILANAPQNDYSWSNYPANNPSVNDLVTGAQQVYQGAQAKNGSMAAGGAHKMIQGGGGIAAQSLLPIQRSQRRQPRR